VIWFSRKRESDTRDRGTKNFGEEGIGPISEGKKGKSFQKSRLKSVNQGEKEKKTANLRKSIWWAPQERKRRLNTTVEKRVSKGEKNVEEGGKEKKDEEEKNRDCEERRFGSLPS